MNTRTFNGKFGAFNVTRDWERDGFLIIEGAHTLDKYQDIRNNQPNWDDFGVFAAFTAEDIIKGVEHAKQLGKMKEGEKVCHLYAGIHGTRENLKKLLDAYDNKDKQIAAECDAQEVYCYEYNNHEAMYGDGEVTAYRIVAEIFGKEVASKIHRFY